MSLDLLKERFGVSITTDKKEVDKEKLNEMFNSNPIGKLESFKSQHQNELEEKDRIIENLEAETSNLAMQVLNLEKDKSNLLNQLNQSQWLENTVASNTKKIYEDKIKEMSYVDSTKLIPLLIEVSRKKQGNTKLNWGKWLETPENIYLFKINESIARKVFEDTNLLIDEKINYINKKRRTYGGTESKWSLTKSIEFTGDTNALVATGNYVSTTFDPDDYNLNQGFTVSYWVKPLELGTRMFALGRKPDDDSMWFFGIRSATKYQTSVGNNKKENANHEMEVGRWYHWVVTYAGHASGADDRDRVVYRDGVKIASSVDNGFAGSVRWPDSQKGVYASGTSAADGGQYVYFGARSNTSRGTFESGASGADGHPYDNGWNCRLTDVSIFNEPKNQDWVTSTYNNGKPTDLTKENGLVGYWIFENGEARDLSGQGNHGTLTTDGTDIPTWEKNGSYE